MMLKYSVSFVALIAGLLFDVSNVWARDIIGETISNRTNNNMGGAIQINNGTDGRWHIQDSKFINNKTTNGGGGAIVINLGKNEPNLDIFIDNTNFENNLSAGIGGAVWMVRNNADMIVTNSQFINNTGTKGGGAFNSGVNEGKTGRVIYEGNLFKDNKSLLISDGVGDLDGGAVRLDSGHIIFRGTNTFENNTHQNGNDESTKEKNDVFVKAGVIDVEGKLILDGGITELVGAKTTTTVLEGGEIVANNPDGETILGNKIINNGTITVDTGRAVRFLTDSENNNVINNDGTITVAGERNILEAIKNAENKVVGSHVVGTEHGKLTLNKGISGTGILNIEEKGEVVVAGDGTSDIDIQNSVDNKGTLTILAGKVLNLLKGITNSSEIVNNGTLDVTGALINTGTITNAKMLNLQNGGTNSGTITNANGVINVNGGELALVKGIGGSAAGTFNVADGATVAVRGEAVKVENKVGNSGTISVESGKSLQLTQEVTNDNVIHNEGTLTTERQLTNNKKLQNNGTFNANGVIVNAKEATLTNNGAMTAKLAMTNSGTFTNNAGASLSLGNGGTNNGTLSNSGTLSVTGGTLTLNKGVAGDGALKIGAAGTVLASESVEIANTVDNKGILTVIKDKILSLLQGGENSGEIKANGTLKIAESFSNSGEINIASEGKLAADGALSNSGTVENEGVLEANDALVNLEGGKIVNAETMKLAKGGENSGVIENNKALEITGGTLTLNKGIDGVGTLTVGAQGAVLAAGSEVVVTNAIVNNGAVDVGENAALTLKNVLTNHETLQNHGTLIAEQRLQNKGSTVNDGTLKLVRGAVNDGTLTNNNKLIVSGGTLTLNEGLQGAGTLSVEANGTLSAGGVEVSVANAVENAGEISAMSGHKFNFSQSVSNSGKLNNNGEMTFAEELVNEKTGTITNNNILNLQNGGSGTGKVDNNGTVNVLGGVLKLSGAVNGTADSKLNVASGAKVLANGADALIANAVDNNGVIEIENGKALKFEKTVTNSGTILNNGQLVSERPLTNKQEMQNNGTFNANGTVENAAGAKLVNTGEFTAAKTMTNSGKITNSADGIMTLNNGAAHNGELDNSGTVTVAGGELVLNNDVSGAGTLGVADGASMSAAADDVSVYNTVKNEGVIKVLAGKILNLFNGGTSMGTITNNGTLNIVGGELKVAGNIGSSASGKLNISSGAGVTANGDNTLIVNTVDNKGTLKVENGKVLTLQKAVTNDGTVVNNGVLKTEATLTNNKKLQNDSTFNANGVIVNAKEATLTNNGTMTAKLTMTNNGTLENAGTLKLVTGLINNATLNNTGKTEIAGGVLTLNSDVGGNGRLVLKDGSGVKLMKDSTTIANKIENATEFEIAEEKTLTLNNDFVNAGTLKNDGIFAAQNITNSSVLYNNAKMTTGNLTALSGAKMYLGVNSITDINGDYSGEGAELYLDMSVDKTNKTVQSGVLNVGGNVSGTTIVFVNALTPDVFAGANGLFVDAPNDTTGADESFTVARVIGSPYMWDSKRKGGEVSGNQWYLQIAEDKKNDDFEGEIPDINPDTPDPDDPNKPDPDDPNKPNPDDPNKPDPDDPNKPDPDDPNKPDPDDPNKPDPDDPNKPNPDDPNKPGDNKPVKPSNPVYAPEVNAYTGLAEAVIEQSRGIADDVRSGLAFEKSVLCYQESCGLAESVPHKRAWAHISNRSATLDTPSETDAKIWGFTAGADFYREYDKRVGIFGFYRNGNYDLSGKGKYLAKTGAEIDNESFAGGLYYQYDNGDNKFLSTVFAGRQNIDFKAGDGFAKANTDADQIGASAEGSRRYQLTETAALEPGIGVSYMAADIDSFTDSVGKSVSYDTLHYWEVEAGIKAEYTFCENGLTRRVYVRPSVIQTYATGDSVKISGIDGRADTYKNQILGRVRAGGQFGLTQKLSGFMDAGYTFGEDYQAYDVQFGLNYAF